MVRQPEHPGISALGSVHRESDDVVYREKTLRDLQRGGEGRTDEAAESGQCLRPFVRPASVLNAVPPHPVRSPFRLNNWEWISVT